jgi:hypothetical protein
MVLLTVPLERFTKFQDKLNYTISEKNNTLKIEKKNIFF